MGARGRIRLNKDSGEKSNKQRFGACSLCGDYKHDTKSHKCSLCGKEGSEKICCSPVADPIPVSRPISTKSKGADKPTKPFSVDDNGGRQTTLLEFVMVNKVEHGFDFLTAEQGET